MDWEQYYRDIDWVIDEIRLLASIGMIDPHALRIAIETLKDEASIQIEEIECDNTSSRS